MFERTLVLPDMIWYNTNLFRKKKLGGFFFFGEETCFMSRIAL
jgi:hypothetical protein